MGFRQRLYNGLDQLINQVDYSRKPKCILFNSHVTGHSDNINSMVLNQHQKLDKVTIPSLDLHIDGLDPVHGLRQLPFHKRRTIAQCAGLAQQERHIVPRLEVTDILCKPAFVLGETLLHEHR